MLLHECHADLFGKYGQVPDQEGKTQTWWRVRHLFIASFVAKRCKSEVINLYFFFIFWF